MLGITWEALKATGTLLKDGDSYTLRTKPSLPFKFDSVSCDINEDGSQGHKVNNGKKKALSKAESLKIKKFIIQFRIPEDLEDINVFGIGDNNEFLGAGRKSDFAKYTNSPPPLPDKRYKWDDNLKEWAHA